MLASKTTIDAMRFMLEKENFAVLYSHRALMYEGRGKYARTQAKHINSTRWKAHKYQRDIWSKERAMRAIGPTKFTRQFANEWIINLY